MPQFHIQDEVDYVYWVESQIARSGGWFESDLAFEHLEVAPDEYAGVRIPKHVVRFSDGTYLSFDLYVDADLQSLKYRYDFRTREGRLIWRKDRHKGHEDLGSLEHIHRGVEGEDAPDKFDAVELDEVMREIHDYQRDGSLP